MRSAIRTVGLVLWAIWHLPAFLRDLAADEEANRRALLADGWSPEAADAALRGELP